MSIIHGSAAANKIMERMRFFVASLLILTICIREGRTQTTGVTTLVCPAVEDYDPCDCSIYDQNEYYIFSSINCQSKGLNDSKVSQILNSFFLPTVTDVRKLLLSDNQLTHVPGQIYSLYELSSIDLSSNRITLITKGTLFNNSRSIVQNVTLKNNQISYIEPGSLNGVKSCNYKSCYLDLQNNLLDRLDFGVFYSVLDYFKSRKTHVLIVDNNPFDCGGCNLSWLVRDNFDLLDVVQGGVCSNGTAFKDLNPYAFNSCEFNCPLPDGKFQNVLDIHSYYKCISYIPYLIDCGELVFVEIDYQNSGCGLPSSENL